ncbi:MAG: LPXTG cell wall anchor domain-containing protein [Oscillospiraceae bacterium]|nr:LPXTG cell wall anchor domain-containing protein [Oscillospiraceae bacterium]
MLKTGDEVPAYPYVFAGIGAFALIALLATSFKKRKRVR